MALIEGLARRVIQCRTATGFHTTLAVPQTDQLHAGLDWDKKSALAFFWSRRPTSTSNYIYIYSRRTCIGPIVRRPTGKMPGMPDYQSSPDSMPRQIEAVIKAKGAPTKY